MRTTNPHILYHTNEAGFPPAPSEAHQRADFETLGDREREQIKDYLRTMREFVCAQFFKSTLEAREAASDVIVNMETGETIKDMYRKIEAKIPYSQIYEEWEYERVCKIKQAASKLGQIHADALFSFAELDKNIDMEKLGEDAAEAIQEAYEELYGKPSDHY